MIKIGLIKKVAIGVCAWAVVLCANEQTATGNSALTLTQQQEDSLVRSIIPSTKIQKVTRSQMDGLYKAYLENGEIIYVNPFKRLIFVGEIYTTKGENLYARLLD